MNVKTIVEVAERLGLCTIVADAGYENDALWFDSNLTEFANEIARIEREECAKICETKKPVSIDKYPDHWKCYEDAWRMREIVAVECAETIRNKS